MEETMESAYITRTRSLIEYIKIHILSLEQDLDGALQGEGYEHLSGQIYNAYHLLAIAEDILE
jgi:hypothetical protein